MKKPNRALAIFAALPVLEAAARHNSFTRAAREFGLTQSALSRRIQSLENDLGVVLFARRGRAILLTQEGARLAEAARGSLDLIEAARHDLGATLSGTIRIGALPSLGSCWLTPRLRSFHEKFPDIQLRIETIDADFLEGHKDPVTWDPSSLDIVITRGFGGWRSLTITKLMDENMVPVKAAGSTTLARLGHSTRSGAWDAYAQAHPPASSFAAPTLVFEHFNMIVEAARAGLGVGLVPSVLVADDLSNGQLETCGPPSPTGAGYYALCSERVAKRPATMAFIDWLRNEAARRPQQGPHVG